GGAWPRNDPLAGTYISIVGRCWPTVAPLGSADINRHRGFGDAVVRLSQAEGNAFHVQADVHLIDPARILGVVVGIIAFVWPGVTVYALVILFAVYAFLDAGLEAARAFSSRTAGPVFGHLLLGLISLAAGVVALVWPRPTALVLVLVIGIWAVAGGIVEIVGGFGKGENPGTPGVFVLQGRVLLQCGVLRVARADVVGDTPARGFRLVTADRRPHPADRAAP